MINKMQKVADLFDLVLGEPFKLRSETHKVTRTVRFSENGMEYFDDSCQRWYPTDGFLKEILTGQAVILDE